MNRKIEFEGETEIESEFDPEFEQEVIHVLCHEMDETQAAILALRYVYDMNDLQIINHTGFPEETVKQHIYNGKKALFSHFSTFTELEQ
jgi:DNA-directed RNA polymerase specialized sigma24 family protein